MTDARDESKDELALAKLKNVADDDVYEELTSIEACCEEYIELCRVGDPPPMEEFAASCAGVESQVLELLPTILMMEKARGRSVGKRKDGRVSTGPEKLPELADFEIVREIGRGGMGIVYEANQISLDRRVALKVLPKHALNERQVERFHTEAATAAKLHHTNIAPVYGVGEKHGVHYFAMQLLQGKTLEQCIGELQLPIDQVISIGRQVAMALQFAHEQGVFHRDIKPANLIMDPNATVWVTDFGLAVTREGIDQNPGKQVAGTLRYMPPEAFDKFDEASPGYDLGKADVYSLAITLIELCSGKPAFQSSGVLDLTEAIQMGRLQPLTFHGKPMPKDLESVLRKAAATNPINRYDSARQFLHELTNVAQGRPVEARSVSAFGQLWSWAKRDPYQAFASSLVVFSVVSTTLVVTFSFLRVQDSLAAEKAQLAKAEQASKLGAQSIDRIFRQFSFDSMFTDEGFELESTKPRLSPSSAAMLKELAGLYDQLALENDDSSLPVKAILARCRVGDIHQRLGDYDVAIKSFGDALSVYSRMIETGLIERTDEVVLQLSRIRNQLGLALKVSGNSKQANEEHQICIGLINQFIERNPQAVNPGLQLELARSNYLAGHHSRPGMDPESLPPAVFNSQLNEPLVEPSQIKNLETAVSILEKLQSQAFVNSDRDSSSATAQILARQADVRQYLLALCHRELADDNWASRTEDDRAHQAEAIQLLEELIQRKPAKALYAFELMRTLAELNVFETGISKADVEEAYVALRRSIKIGQELVERQPDVREYRVETLHAYFKLSKIAHAKSKFAKAEEKTNLLKEQERTCRQALLGQSFLARQRPDSDAYRVWVAKFSLELAQCPSMIDRRTDKNRLISRAISILFNLSDKYREKPEVAAIVDQAKRMSNELLMNEETGN